MVNYGQVFMKRPGEASFLDRLLKKIEGGMNARTGR
jgi:hypothetical protein